MLVPLPHHLKQDDLTDPEGSRRRVALLFRRWKLGHLALAPDFASPACSLERDLLEESVRN